MKKIFKIKESDYKIANDEQSSFAILIQNVQNILLRKKEKKYKCFKIEIPIESKEIIFDILNKNGEHCYFPISISNKLFTLFNLKKEELTIIIDY